MMQPPEYFERVRKEASEDWDLLDSKPSFAGAWQQLFMQVRNPRNVVSELLQNADDAHATEATVRIENGEFIFTHNGEDFIEDHFHSLCRFGCSNKRALHTIGFRGIGFKSTFSLGDVVALFTPTLSVSFHRRRFTEPNWIPNPPSESRLTRICVPISESNAEQAVKESLELWLESPVSLLFFQHIRKLTIGEHELHWESLGPGPAPESEWFALAGSAGGRLLLARSTSEPFSDDALEEIKQERLLGVDQETDFPPCRVEIVLGALGQLYAVLPTGVKTALPFASNAPFVQDPGRGKIKELGISPTNRWLLARVGKLAASILLHWLRQENLSIPDRSESYDLFPDVDRNDHTLEGICATAVELEFGNSVKGQPILLTESGDLTECKGSIVLPEQLLEVWPGDQATALLDDRNRPALSRYISDANRNKLLSWAMIEEITRSGVLNILRTRHPPKPDTWRQLAKLWGYILPEFLEYPLVNVGLRLVPAQGSEVLHAASEVVRVGKTKILQTDSDWEFLSEHLLVLNQGWLTFLDEHKVVKEGHNDLRLSSDLRAVSSIMDGLGIQDTNDVSGVIERVANGLFKKNNLLIADCVRFAQIAAKLDASLTQSFRFVTRDSVLRNKDSGVLYDQDGALEDLLPENWRPTHMLHPDYARSFTSCTSEEWRKWLASGRAGLSGFVPISTKSVEIIGRDKSKEELRRRGFEGNFQEVLGDVNRLTIVDWSFDEQHWQHWAKLSESDPMLWGRIVEFILAQPESAWSHCQSSKAQGGFYPFRRKMYRYELKVLPEWVIRLREQKCLPDHRGFYRRPTDLFSLTPETAPLIGVEPFVRSELDNEKTRPFLMLFGVQFKPNGPDRLLQNLRALSEAEKPPSSEVDKLYRSLDSMLDNCSTAERAVLKRAFQEEKIILSENGRWSNSGEVFLSSGDEDLPGTEIVRASVRELALWRKLDIATQPTLELAIQWIKSLPSEKRPSPDDARRVRGLLSRHGARIFAECHHWMNLAGEWVGEATLEYAITRKSLVSFDHLHEWVRQKTADLKLIPPNISEAAPFSEIPRLAGLIEERFEQSPMVTDPPLHRTWIAQLGAELARIELEDEVGAVLIRARAADLAVTVWQTAPELELIPYIGGVPAGMPRRADAIWSNKVLYVKGPPNAKLAQPVSLEIGRAFNMPAIVEAVKYCFEREYDWVSDYMESNFTLIPHQSKEVLGIEVGDEDQESDTPGSDVSAGLRGGVGEVGTPLNGVEYHSPAVCETVPRQTDENQSGEIDSEFGESDGAGAVRRNSRPPKPAMPTIIERFALANGFAKDEANRYFHSDGSWISKPPGTQFWQLHSKNGRPTFYYWAVDHCLDREPLEIDHETWIMIVSHPDTYSVVLARVDDSPIEIKGSQLSEMQKSGELVVYPATYRLRKECRE